MNIAERKSIKKNYILNTIYQVLTICVPLITTPYLSRVLGVDSIGIYSYCNSIVSYFILFAVLGSSTFGQRKIAEVRDDKKKLSKAFWEIVLFRMMTVIIILVAYLVFLHSIDQYRIIFMILSLNIINVLVDITWFYQGIEDFPKIVFRNLIIRIAQVICIFVFIKKSTDLPVYVCFISIFTIIANIWAWMYVPQYVEKPLNLHIFSNVKEMLLLFLPTIATQVYLVLDKSMIGVITNSTYQNGCYEQSEKIARMALTVVTSAAAVILPRVANLYNNGKQQQAKAYIYKGYRFVWMLSFPIMFGIIAVSKTFVPVFLGEGFELAIILMPIFSVLVLAVSAAYVSGYAFLIPIGKQNIYTIVVCISAIVNFVMNLILIPRIGAVGAALASVVAEVVGAVLQIFYCCVSGELEFKNIFLSVWKYIISGIIMLVSLLLIQEQLGQSVVSLIILILCGSLIYFSSLMVLRDSFFIENLHSIICIKKKKN